MTHTPDSFSINPPRVSIIIPCYNQAHYLQESVESALHQHGAETQVIVVNDGSPDSTAQVARQWGTRILYIEQQNRGLAAARNRGLQSATGDFVIFLDADDALLPDSVQRHLSSLGGGDTADVSMCGYIELTQSSARGPDHAAPQIPPDVFHALLAGNWMPPVCIMARRSCIQRVQGFRPYPGLEDWDLWLRLAADPSTRFVSAPDARVLYRTYASSMSGNSRSMFHSMLNVLADYHSFHPGCALCKAALAAGRQSAYAFYCRRMRDQWRTHHSPRTLLQCAGQMLTHPPLLSFACRTFLQKRPPHSAPLAGGPAHE